jgi:hypothetical protein
VIPVRFPGCEPDRQKFSGLMPLISPRSAVLLSSAPTKVPLRLGNPPEGARQGRVWVAPHPPSRIGVPLSCPPPPSAGCAHKSAPINPGHRPKIVPPVRFPARQAAWDRFEKLVDPEGKLPHHVRRQMAESARKEHFKRMALKSAESRRRRKGLANFRHFESDPGHSNASDAA